MTAHFYGVPLAIPPEEITRDLLELVLNAQQEALLQIDLALDNLS